MTKHGTCSCQAKPAKRKTARKKTTRKKAAPRPTKREALAMIDSMKLPATPKSKPRSKYLNAGDQNMIEWMTARLNVGKSPDFVAKDVLSKYRWQKMPRSQWKERMTAIAKFAKFAHAKNRTTYARVMGGRL